MRVQSLELLRAATVRRGSALLLAVALAGCGAPNGRIPVEQGTGDGPAPPRPAPALEAEGTHAEAAAGARTLGSVAGVPLSTDDLLSAWHAVSPRDLWLLVDKLVATRLARAEAGRLALRLEPEPIEAEFGRERARLEASVAEAAPDVSVEEFVAGRLGVDPQRYFASMRAATVDRMLTERVARAWILAQESRAVRLLVVEADDAEEVAAALSAGGDLATLARERSLDDTGDEGGLVPYLVDTDGSLLSRAAFEASQGELVGPLESEGLVLFLRVESVRPPLVGDWDAVGAAVEESLSRQPLADSEYVPWKIAMERSWPVDLEPLAELVGARR